MKSNFYQSLDISYLDKFWIWIGLFFANFTNENKATAAKLVNCHYVNSDKVKFKIRLQNGFGLIVKACSLLPPPPSPPQSTYNQGPFLLLARDVCQTRVISTENWNCNGRCWVLWAVVWSDYLFSLLLQRGTMQIMSPAVEIKMN